ncbi:MAG: hypothetical protein E6J22_12415 [Chloroflexi bacterium]|nr:MAG: hypothetical protein E6J22_12415 [Chloroflexota bacterium]
MPFQDYVALMKQEALSEYQQDRRTHPRLTQGRLWAPASRKSQRDQIKHLHHECPARDDASFCLLRSCATFPTGGAEPASRRRPTRGSLPIPLVPDCQA